MEPDSAVEQVVSLDRRSHGVHLGSLKLTVDKEKKQGLALCFGLRQHGKRSPQVMPWITRGFACITFPNR